MVRSVRWRSTSLIPYYLNAHHMPLEHSSLFAGLSLRTTRTYRKIVGYDRTPPRCSASSGFVGLASYLCSVRFLS
jgi:hypothetical protein